MSTMIGPKQWLRWRAAGRLADEALQTWFAKLRQKGELPKLTGLYRMGKPAQARARICMSWGWWALMPHPP